MNRPHEIFVNDAPYVVEAGEVIAFEVKLNELHNEPVQRLVIRSLGIDNEKYILRKDVDHVWYIYRLRGRDWVKQ